MKYRELSVSEHVAASFTAIHLRRQKAAESKRKRLPNDSAKKMILPTPPHIP